MWDLRLNLMDVKIILLFKVNLKVRLVTILARERLKSLLLRVNSVNTRTDRFDGDLDFAVPYFVCLSSSKPHLSRCSLCAHWSCKLGRLSLVQAAICQCTLCGRSVDRALFEAPHWPHTQQDTPCISSESGHRSHYSTAHQSWSVPVWSAWQEDSQRLL